MPRSFHALMVAVALGCSGEPATIDEALGSDTLVIAVSSDLGNQLSVLIDGAMDQHLVNNIGFRLIDTDFDCSLKKKPMLATEWSWSADGKVLAMTLRDDLTWEDGEKVTARDVALTMELAADPAVASPRLPFVEHLEPDGRPKVVDDTHLEWHFTHSYDRDAQMRHIGSLAVVPAHRLVDADRGSLRAHELNRKPLSNGPWRLKTWEPNAQIVLEPNAAFTGPDSYRPRLASVVFKVIPEYENRLMQLQNGDVDLMTSVTIAAADALPVERRWRGAAVGRWFHRRPEEPCARWSGRFAPGSSGSSWSRR